MCKAYSSIHSEPGSNSSMFNNLINKIILYKSPKKNYKTLINKTQLVK